MLSSITTITSTTTATTTTTVTMTTIITTAITTTDAGGNTFVTIIVSTITEVLPGTQASETSAPEPTKIHPTQTRLISSGATPNSGATEQSWNCRLFDSYCFYCLHSGIKRTIFVQSWHILATIMRYSKSLIHDLFTGERKINRSLLFKAGMRLSRLCN